MEVHLAHNQENGGSNPPAVMPLWKNNPNGLFLTYAKNINTIDNIYNIDNMVKLQIEIEEESYYKLLKLSIWFEEDIKKEEAQLV